MSYKKIIFLVGPTASGKSRVSYELASQFNAVVVNCDSLQVYDKLDIGTAKPSPDEMKNCPHYLFDCVALGDEFTAGKYRQKALQILKETDHETYIFVGGSGFYIRALVEGMFEEVPVKKEAQAKVNELKKNLSKLELYEELKKHDPAYASKIHHNDQYRVTRALEMNLSLSKTMKTISDEFESKKKKIPYPYIYIGLDIDREVLRGRVSERLDIMLHNGFRGEVEKFISLGLKKWKPMASVGYKEMVSLIDGHLSELEMKEEVIKNTMRLAKRQMTWFRANKNIRWFQPYDLDSMSELCRQFLFE